MASIQICKMRIIGCFADAHKLEIVLDLMLQGWIGVRDASKPHIIGGDKTFSWHMTSRSKLYFAALLNASSLQRKGLLTILASMPHSYYRCLLELDSLQPLLMLTDADLKTLPELRFQACLKGQPLLLDQAALPIADSPIDHAEDMAERGDFGSDVEQ